MPLFRDTSPYYDNTTFYPYSFEWGNVVATDASGIATWYLTDTGAAGGNALFTNIFQGSIVITPWNTSSSNLVYITVTPTVAADKKTITCQVKQNQSLLSLGLLPFTTAASGVMMSLRCRGVQ